MIAKNKDHTYKILEYYNIPYPKTLTIKNIKKINENFEKQKINFKVLHGCEANILNDGSIDIKDEVLEKLDYVIAGVHSNLKMDKKESRTF